MELRRPLENPSSQSSPFTWQSHPTSLAEFDAVCVIEEKKKKMGVPQPIY